MKIIELLTEALGVANIIGTARPVSEAVANTAFRALIGLTDTMNADPLKKITTARIIFLTQPGQLSYTIGADSSLDINKPRPQAILRANVAYANTDPIPVFTPIVVLTDDAYRRTQIRTAPAPMPSAIWYDRGYNPLAFQLDPPLDPALPVPGYGTINLIGMPTAANFIELFAAAPLTQASSVFDDLVFPPAYYEYLLYGTTIRLYPRFGRAADPTVLALFKDAQIALETANAQPAPVSPLDSGMPNATGGYWDARTNSYVGRG